jgi:hypothetical protein
MKYGGGMDSLDYKLTIFHDLCGKADIPRDIYMLKHFQQCSVKMPWIIFTTMLIIRVSH